MVHSLTTFHIKVVKLPNEQDWEFVWIIKDGRKQMAVF